MVKELRVKSYYQHADGRRNLKNIKNLSNEGCSGSNKNIFSYCHGSLQDEASTSSSSVHALSFSLERPN